MKGEIISCKKELEVSSKLLNDISIVVKQDKIGTAYRHLYIKYGSNQENELIFLGDIKDAHFNISSNCQYICVGNNNNVYFVYDIYNKIIIYDMDDEYQRIVNTYFKEIDWYHPYSKVKKAR